MRGVRRTAATRPAVSSAWQQRSTFSYAVRLANSRMFWNVRAMPSRHWRGPATADDSLPPKTDRRPRRLVDAGDQVEHRGLAGAVRADQADQLARADLQAKGRRPPSGRRTRSVQPRASSESIGALTTASTRRRRRSRLHERPAGRAPDAEQPLRARDHQHDQQRASRSPCGTPATRAQHLGQERQHDRRRCTEPADRCPCRRAPP